MLLALTLALSPVLGDAMPPLPIQARDTVRLEVGSPLVSGRLFAPHAARVRVRVGTATEEGPVTAEWTNELTISDSAGRRIHQWVTKGTQFPPNGSPVTWELRQHYDAETMAPYAIVSRSSTGAAMDLAINGREVRGTRRAAGSAEPQPVNLTLQQPGWVASASDLVPLAAGLRDGAVMIAPLWGPSMPDSELRVFAVLARVTIPVEGTPVQAWKVEERRHADRVLLATWYLLNESPYMVYGEVPLAGGRIQRMSEVAIPMSRR